MYYNDYDYLFYFNPCKSSIMDENMQIPPTFRSAYINTFIIQVQGSICWPQMAINHAWPIEIIFLAQMHINRAHVFNIGLNAIIVLGDYVIGKISYVCRVK